MKEVSMEVLNVQMVDIDKVVANDYNPNKVAKPEMKLLERSIIDNGFCMPIICIYDKENDKYVIVDGFHRYTVSLKLNLEQVPIVVLKHDIKKRVAATIQFNRARGTHQIPDMAKIVLSLYEKGWNDYEISEHLGMDLDEVIRLKQMNGLKEAFANHIFSKSWEEFEKNNIEEKEIK
ncbi:ParB-like nuclease domain-containing protein [Fusobacterium polymorphum]|jgi:parB-like nuclease domain-containing protein|uniref:IbrB-like domain-containing protein n=1 Tax=Fusobacterium nucleatum subsp. polymorphum TaxID=76857 RepID=UPI00206B846F|nr:MAG TPA: chromosome partitioning protein [Caudoviricetes sp.]